MTHTNPQKDQFNSITCDPDGYTCTDTNLVFNAGCVSNRPTADPTCNSNGSHNNDVICTGQWALCGVLPDDTKLDDYSLYKERMRI